MRRAYYAGKSGYLEEFLGNGKPSAWESVKVRECYNEVGQVQDILRKSIDFLRRIIMPVEGQGGVTLSSVFFLIVTAFRLKTMSGGSGQGTRHERT